MRKGAAFGIIAVMVGTMLLASIPTVSASEELYGDANGDGKIDMRDVTYVGLIILGKKPANELADANQDGRINVLDITYIELIILGKVSKYPLRAGTTYSFEPVNIFRYYPWWRTVRVDFTHMGLVTHDEQLNVVPCLAENWEISGDGKSITFYLIENAKWHDGKPVTAEDVKFTLDYISVSYIYTNYFDHVEVVDDYTVTLYATKPVGAVLLKSLVYAPILPKHIWEKVDEPKKYTGKDGMIGCGPFVFEDYDPVAEIVRFKSNRNFFMGKPSIDRVEWKYYRTVDSMLLALKKGEIDTTFNSYVPVSGVYAATLVDVEDMKLGVVPEIGVLLNLEFGYKRFLTMENMMSEAQFKKFREAISYAIDYQQLVNMIMAGYGEVPSRGYVPPTALGYDPDIPKLKHDITKANEILDTLGFIDTDGDGIRNLPDGRELSFFITPPMWRPNNIRATEVICYQLKKIGIDAYMDEEVLGSEDRCDQRIFVDRDYYLCIYYSTSFAITFDVGGVNCANMTGADGTCSDPEFIELVENARYAKTLEEREEAVRELQQYYKEELPMIALVWGKVLYPYRTDRFTGWLIQDGFGNMNLWTWFRLKPVAG